MDIFDLFLDLLNIRQTRIQINLEYLEGEEWFKRLYGRKLLNAYEFRNFIKNYDLKKVFQDEVKKEKFKNELQKWVVQNWSPQS